MGLYLYLPSSDGGPYQPVIYWGGISWLLIDDIDYRRMALTFILENGRAVALPVIKGTFHRRNETVAPWSTIAGRDLVIDEVIDVRRTIDYLETRDDIDADASQDDIEAIVAQSQKRSAVYDILTNPTNVEGGVK